ncbi:MAG: chorismate synthase [Thermoplasmatota archaeon]
MNTLGSLFRLSLLGESHGALVGALVDGVPAGLPFSEADVQPELDRRRPGQSLVSTQRAETDRVQILSGVFQGRTTGAPILMTIPNEDTESSHYERTRMMPRPGHSDFPAWAKFGGLNDYRGGGMFSARLTAAMVMGGALARKVLAAWNVEIAAHACAIGGIRARDGFDVASIRRNVERTPVRCADLEAAKRMEAAIMDARAAKDSVGGIVECIAENVPTGWGEPNADSVEAALAHAIFTIPATKGIEFGTGFGFAEKRGSEVVDAYEVESGHMQTRANHNGGILGGITTGSPIRFRVALKPTSSIAQPVPTVDLSTGEAASLETKGRHDPCIVPRAVPVIEAASAIVLADLALRDRGIHGRERRTGGWVP